MNAVQHVRKEADKKGFNVVVSPRCTVRVAKALALGLTPNEVKAEIMAGMTEDQQRQIKGVEL